MEVYERIRQLRKEMLHLSQTEFGEKLGVSRSVIKNIELDVLARPDQKEPLYKLICKEFRVSYNWLMYGVGDPFAEDLEEDEFTQQKLLLPIRVLRSFCLITGISMKRIRNCFGIS